MKTLEVITIIETPLEEMVKKMLKNMGATTRDAIESNIDEVMKKAMNLKNKAYNYFEENKEEFVRLIGANI